MKVKATWLSSEYSRGFLASNFYCVERGSWTRWVALWAHEVES